MPHLKKADTVLITTYRPEQRVCPLCHSVLKRGHILWRKYMLFSTGAQVVTSWAYRCPQADCPGTSHVYRSAVAEKLHLRQRRFSRELVVRVGYRRFWQHHTLDELHAWLTQELQLVICRREVANLMLDFLALLGAAQPARIREQLSRLPGLLIAIDGMQPEKGNDCLYIVRELQCRVTLLAVNLADSSQEALCEHIFAPPDRLGARTAATLAGRGQRRPRKHPVSRRPELARCATSGLSVALLTGCRPTHL